MDDQKRGCSAPVKVYQYKTKQEANRRSYPPCPPGPPKKSLKRMLFPEKSSPKPVFFTKPVSLSRMYNSSKDVPYFEQVYVKEKSVGQGSFGIVFKAKSREDNEVYAIKELKAGHPLKYGYAEVRNCEKVGFHCNCVQYFMAWEESNTIHLKMEYCQLSLGDFARSNNIVEESQLWEVLFDILRGLNFLHKKKLIHLDIKPANIMMKWGYYKITDFGLLVDLNIHDGRKISTISDGDSKYLACEVLDGIYTSSCDIFGLGISLLELSSNIQLPEFGPLWHQIRKEFLPPSFYSVVSPQFSRIIERMMTLAHWERPTAATILKYASLKKVKKHDSSAARRNYIPEDYPRCQLTTNENNNIIETPRRPLCELRRSSSPHPEILSANRRALTRVKLHF